MLWMVKMELTSHLYSEMPDHNSNSDPFECAQETLIVIWLKQAINFIYLFGNQLWKERGDLRMNCFITPSSMLEII